jgi:hypothetical protein
MTGAWQAGVARVPLPTPLGAPLMGYAARSGGAVGVHDPLYARALLLRSRDSVLWLSLDVCLVTPAQARELREAAAARLGLARERVLVTCTHTHSGPETGDSAASPKAPGGAWRGIRAAALEAGAGAAGALRPARLGLGSAPVSIGRNRRRADGPVERRVQLFRLGDAGGEPLALIYALGCHPTALGHDNLAYSADWPGAASRALERRFPGALAFFALTAHGDVDPVTRGLQDIAVPGRSVGVGFAAMEALGAEVARAVEAAEADATDADPDAGVALATARLRLPVHGAADGADARTAALAARRAVALAALDLPLDTQLRGSELLALAHERLRGRPLDEARQRLALLRLYLRDRAAPRVAGGLEAEVEIALLRLGPALLLGLPFEPTVEVGRQWAERAVRVEQARGRGAAPGLVLSIANGWLRYLPHPREFAAPGAETAYEVLTSTFAPDAAERLLEAGERLALALGEAA